MPDVQSLPLAQLHLRQVLSMLDGYGRQIAYLRLSVTELCNLRCRYCMPAEGICKKSHQEMLTEDEMILAVEAAASLGVRKLRITGGEPLGKPNILSICRRAAAVEGIDEVCITTNGLLLPKLARPLREAGVKRVNLSLDTLNPEKYANITRCGTLTQAMDGLHAALTAGFDRVKVNVVLIGGFNDDEIVPLAELTKQYPIDVRFIELMPIENHQEFGPAARIPCTVVLERLPELEAVDGDGGVAKLYRLPGAQGRVGLISPLSDCFCPQCTRLRLTADGKLKPCLLSSAEYPIKGLRGEAMLAQFRAAIAAKPQGHTVGACPVQTGRHMNQIGG